MAETPTNAQKIAAEVIGTFTLVFFGCGSAIFSGGDYAGIALAFGLTVLCGAYAFGRISGAHFNPAVTVGAALGGRIAWKQTPLYIGSQLVGGLIAGLVLFILVQGIPDYDVGVSGLAQNSFGDDGSGYAVWAAFLLEVILTAVFVWVILAVTDARNEHPALAPLAIGLALTMVHLASIGATGTSVNPARSIGVGVFAGGDAIIQLWLFILAPLVGGAIAGISYPILFGHGSDPVPGSGLRAAGAVPGYGAPDQLQQEWNQGTATTTGTAVAQEPIVQDGWEWDHAAQEWKPQEQPAAPPAAPATPAAPASAADPVDPIDPADPADPAGPTHPASPPS